MSNNDAREFDFSDINDPSVRYDAFGLLEIVNGNPNGDPDMDGRPRTKVAADGGTLGLISKQCLARKPRNFVQDRWEGREGYEIWVREGYPTNVATETVADQLKKDQDRDDVEFAAAVRSAMAKRYFDVRMFGAVLTKENAGYGGVKGPMQLGTAESVHPIRVLRQGLTRAVGAKEKKSSGSSDTGRMGKKYIVPYGLYRFDLSFNPVFAQKTGVGPEDLDAFWEAMALAWDHDRSANRHLRLRKLWVFKHSHKFGSAPSYQLEESIRIQHDVEEPQSFGDFAIDVDTPPEGVSLHDLV